MSFTLRVNRYFLFISLSYVWTTLDVGYVQGMCDLLAPLLVIFNDGKWTKLFSIQFQRNSFGAFVSKPRRLDGVFML